MVKVRLKRGVKTPLIILCAAILLLGIIGIASLACSKQAEEQTSIQEITISGTESVYAIDDEEAFRAALERYLETIGIECNNAIVLADPKGDDRLFYVSANGSLLRVDVSYDSLIRYSFTKCSSAVPGITEPLESSNSKTPKAKEDSSSSSSNKKIPTQDTSSATSSISLEGKENISSSSSSMSSSSDSASSSHTENIEKPDTQSESSNSENTATEQPLAPGYISASFTHTTKVTDTSKTKEWFGEYAEQFPEIIAEYFEYKGLSGDAKKAEIDTDSVVNNGQTTTFVYRCEEHIVSAEYANGRFGFEVLE